MTLDEALTPTVGRYRVLRMGRTTWRSIAYYVVIAAVLLLIVANKLTLLLPDQLAVQIGRNSESLLFALLICAQIQYLRPVLLRLAHPWLVIVPGAVFFFVAGYLLEHSSLPPALVTLNEPLIAAGFMLLLIGLPRPLVWAPLIGLGFLVFVIVFFKTAFVLDQAESLVPMVIAPFALDVFDRAILEPEQRDRPRLRGAWCVALVVVGVAFMVGARWARKDLHGPIRFGLDYGERASEAYWGWLLVHFYFSYWLRHSRSHAQVEPIEQVIITPGSLR